MWMEREEVAEMRIGRDEVFGVIGQEGKTSEEERTRWEDCEQLT
jgi:hypothetical protein